MGTAIRTRAPDGVRERAVWVFAAWGAAFGVTATLGACADPTADRQGRTESRVVASIVNGGTRADTLRLLSAASAQLEPGARRTSAASGVAAVSGAPRARAATATRAATVALAAADPAPLLCGVNSATLPRGVLLYPGTIEEFFVTSWRAQPVVDALTGGRPACGPEITVQPEDHPLFTNANPKPVEDIQTGPVEVRFASAVASVSVYGNGAFECYTGQYGHLTAYDVNDAVVATAEMQMRDPPDCGADEITFGAYGTVAGPLVLIRRVVIDPPLPLMWEATFLGSDIGPAWVSARYFLTFPAPPPPMAVTISSVSGSNAHGSFTSRPGENALSLNASVAGGAPGAAVHWTIADDPADHVASVAPLPFTGAATATALVPVQDTMRWVGVPHRAALDYKALRYLVTATVTDGVQVATSAPFPIQQSEVDALREEYVEYGIPMPNPAWIVSSVPAGSTITFAQLNQGDYATYAVLAPWLADSLTAIQTTAHYQLKITSGYRDPMHHRLHVHLDSGKVAVALSNHQYGVAADIATFSSRQRWNDLHGFAKEHNACVEPVEHSTTDHVHADWRPGIPCPRGW